MRGYYFITDQALSRRGNASDCRRAVSAGVEFVQFRCKQASARSLLEEACKLRRICAKAKFLVNDRVDIALACGADGVHLGQDDLPCAAARKLLGKRKIIGVTVHSVKEALKAQREGADYVAVSPVFSTSTKKDAGKAVGLDLVSAISKKVRIPVAAIGGINLGNAAKVIAAGADSVCAISCVVTRPDVKKVILKFRRLFPERT